MCGMPSVVRTIRAVPCRPGIVMMPPDAGAAPAPEPPGNTATSAATAPNATYRTGFTRRIPRTVDSSTPSAHPTAEARSAASLARDGLCRHRLHVRGPVAERLGLSHADGWPRAGQRAAGAGRYRDPAAI